MNAASRARILVLLEKELRELFAARMLLASVILVPLLLGGVALTMGWAAGEVSETTQHDPHDLEELRQIMGDRIAHVTDLRDALELYVGEMGLLVILLLPALLPPILAAQTLVREKQSRSLETLLVTPLRTWEIVLAKVIFCAGLGVIPEWIVASIYYALIGSRCSAVALASLASPGWIVMLAIGTPLVAVLGVGLGVAVSSRAKDAQTAQQIAGMVVLPIVGLLIMQSLGVTSLGGLGALVFVGAVAIADTVVLALAISLFERETVVTGWK
ncbi:MAG: ABC transporter permease subunit [Deltaproteobacteria bacterium]|nr:ABC transporter permease subunit [Deltaproteobacteria bacterium]